MEWKVTIKDDGNPIGCVVEHEEKSLKAGLVKTVSPTHPLLKNWTPPAGWAPLSDEYVLVYLDPNLGGPVRTATIFPTIKRNDNPENHNIIVIPIESSTNTRKGNGKRSQNKVSDEQGGS